MSSSSLNGSLRLALLALLACPAALPAAQADRPAPPPSRAAPATAAAAQVAEAPAPPTLESLLPNGRRPRPGLLVGGQPSEAQLLALRNAGVRTLVDVRTPAEPGATDPAQAERLGFRFLRIPIGGTQDLTRENAAALAEALSENARNVDPDGRTPPLALTCGSGNRAAALLALSAYWIDGLPASEAFDLGLRAGLTRLEPTVRALLGLPSQ
jgi:protein tyrosine phosphatase (PTP) superfamily phosphohydrolase (DUF442 family)